MCMILFMVSNLWIKPVLGFYRPCLKNRIGMSQLLACEGKKTFTDTLRMNVGSPLFWANHVMYWQEASKILFGIISLTLIHRWFLDGALLPPEDEQKKSTPLLPGKSAELNLNEIKEPQNQQYEVHKYLWLVTCEQKCSRFALTISNSISTPNAAMQDARAWCIQSCCSDFHELWPVNLHGYE